MVNPDIPGANLVRQEAGTSSPALGELHPGMRIKVLEGPVCSDGYTWFYEEARKSELVSWTAKGDSKEQWLIPAISE